MHFTTGNNKKGRNFIVEQDTLLRMVLSGRCFILFLLIGLYTVIENNEVKEESHLAKSLNECTMVYESLSFNLLISSKRTWIARGMSPVPLPTLKPACFSASFT